LWKSGNTGKWCIEIKTGTDEVLWRLESIETLSTAKQQYKNIPFQMLSVDLEGHSRSSELWSTATSPSCTTSKIQEYNFHSVD